MLTIDTIRDYCLQKKGTSEYFPFDYATLVCRVGPKMFCLVPLDARPLRINLKCNPLYALDLREQYPAITAGYHMNKRHWNTVLIDGSIPDQLVLELIDHSYDLVFRKLSKKERSAIIEQ